MTDDFLSKIETLKDIFIETLFENIDSGQMYHEYSIGFSEEIDGKEYSFSIIFRRQEEN